MKQKTVKTWEELEQELGAVQRIREEAEATKRRTYTFISDLLYRGQPDSTCRLETTLERACPYKFTLRDYYKLALAAHPQVESFTDREWKIPSLTKYGEWLAKENPPFITDFPAYPYLAYLRHHGFPSPLLDWTASPYVAAFFAMNKIAKDVKSVSIYVYWGFSAGHKGAWEGQPVIKELGPYARIHRRHFLQQSRYTICTNSKNGELYYDCHEEIVSLDDPTQDLLWKFNIPVTEKTKVLRQLNTMNINAFSLFGTEESLMDSIATSELLIKGRCRPSKIEASS
jgi:hypothetical protein